MNVYELFSSLLEKRTLYPLLLISFISVTHFFAGALGARIYAMNLFDSLKMPSVYKNWVTISSSAANVAGSITTLFVLTYTGKRNLALVTFTLTSLMTISLGSYVYVKDQIQEPWLFVVLFFIMAFVAGLGMGIPWMLTGEIFPVRTRNAGSGLFAVIFDFSLFFFSKTYFAMDKFLGTPMYFIVHGLIGLSGCLFLFLYMPETEGKTLAQIERIFLRK